jgi:hypothetical protein
VSSLAALQAIDSRSSGISCVKGLRVHASFNGKAVAARNLRRLYYLACVAMARAGTKAVGRACVQCNVRRFNLPEAPTCNVGLLDSIAAALTCREDITIRCAGFSSVQTPSSFGPADHCAVMAFLRSSPSAGCEHGQAATSRCRSALQLPRRSRGN